MSPDFSMRHSTENETAGKFAGEGVAIISGSYTATQITFIMMHHDDCIPPREAGR